MWKLSPIAWGWPSSPTKALANLEAARPGRQRSRRRAPAVEDVQVDAQVDRA
jgi:hypothetical protein